MKAVRTKLVAAATAVAAAIATWSAAPAAADPAGNWIAVDVSTIDVDGVVNSDPTGVQGSAVNISTGESFALTSVPGTLWRDGLPNGTYRLRIARSGNWAPVWWPGAYSQAASGVFVLDTAITDCSPVDIGPTGCNGMKFTVQLQQTRTVTGTVSRRSGERVAGATVNAVLAKEPLTRFTTATDGTGQFSVSVPPGVYELSTPNGNRQAAAAVDVQASTVRRSLVLLDPPAAPTEVAAAGSSRSASVTWTPPTDDGGTAVTGYTVSAQPGGHSCSTTGARGCTLTGLTNGQPYAITVTATNAVGTSAASLPTAVTPNELLPGPPTSVNARALSRAAIVSWSPPADTLGVSGYRVTSKPGGLTCTTSDLTCTVTGLTNGTRYTFRVAAITAGGSGPASASSNRVTPADISSSPRNVRLQAGNSSVMVTWKRPADNGGAAITGYTATSFPSGRTCTTDGSVRACAIGGLTNGAAYSVVVTATNPMGTSDRSPGSTSATPRAGLPAMASQLTVTPKSGRVTGGVRIAWTATVPAHRVLVRWQRADASEVTSRTANSAGSLRVPVAPGSRTQVWLQAVDSRGRPVAEVRRTFRRG